MPYLNGSGTVLNTVDDVLLTTALNHPAVGIEFKGKFVVLVLCLYKLNTWPLGPFRPMIISCG